MNSPKTVIILVLAATTLGGAVIAWKQYGELVELRAAAMNKDERADLQKRVWDLEKSNRDLQAQLSATRGGAGELEGMLATTNEGERAPRERGGRGERGGDSRGREASALRQATAIRELMNKPEVQAMLSLQQKSAIEARYATLFKNLNLPPEQVEKLKTLLAERSTTMQDVMGASRDQGLNPRENPEAFRKLMTDAQNEINTSIKAVIGEQGFAQLSSYEQTMPQRNLVNELQQRLSYTSTPLTSAQAEQMVQVLAATAPVRTSSATPTSPGDGMSGPRGGPPPGGFSFGPGGRGGPDVGGMIAGVLGGGPGMNMLSGAFDGGGRGGSASVPVTTAAVTQAQSFLAAPQVAALQQIQQQQQTHQQLRQLVNETLFANQPSPPSKSGGTADQPSAGTTTGGTPPSRRPGGGR